MPSAKAVAVHFLGLVAGKIRSQFGFRYRFLTRLYFWLVREPLGTALYGIDAKLSEIVGSRGQRGFFVELGANNGISQSNTLLFEIRDGWRGILIEPIKAIFQELEANRNGRRNRLVRAACVSFDYPSSIVEMEYLNLMSVAIGIPSDLPDLQRHRAEGNSFLREGDISRIESVPARTLTSILDEALAPKHIDLLSLDVEGAELEVLRGLDFDRYFIEWIIVETRSKQDMISFLESMRYQHVADLTSHDLLFKCPTPS